MGNNNCGCGYDGGDCCKQTVKGGTVKTSYCKACKCLDPKYKPKADPNCKGSCGVPKYKGDGNCDDENNVCGCGYDGGDCCAKSVKGGVVKKNYCKACKCVDPKNQATGGACPGSCGSPTYKGDGNCDDDNNNCGCDYDGGDCCGPNADKNYCTDCQCLDPNAGGNSPSPPGPPSGPPAGPPAGPCDGSCE